MSAKPFRSGITTVEWILLFAVIGIVGFIIYVNIGKMPVRRGHSPRITCINNLRQIDGAIEQWALENKHCEGEPVIETEAVAYIKNGLLPTCPEGGRYLFGKVGGVPRSTIPDHALR
jgi:hypothetical protein